MHYALNPLKNFLFTHELHLLLLDARIGEAGFRSAEAAPTASGGGEGPARLDHAQALAWLVVASNSLVVVAGSDDYDGGGDRRTEAVGLDVHTMDTRAATGSSKRRGSLRQWLEVMRRRRGKEDATAWSSTLVLKPSAL